MKLFCLLVVLFAIQAIAEGNSREELRSETGKLGQTHLTKLRKFVSKNIIDQAKYIISNQFFLNPTPEVQTVLGNYPESWGIIALTGNLIHEKAEELNQKRPSHEGIGYDLGPIPYITAAEESLGDVVIDPFPRPDIQEPSHEGILHELGKMVFDGIGHLVGGHDGDSITENGDIVGHILFLHPRLPTSKAVSKESIVSSNQETSHEGILNSLSKVISKGAGKFAGGILGRVFDEASGALGNIFLAQGTFKGYRSISGPVNEIIAPARKEIRKHQHTSKECFKVGNRNLTEVSDDYMKHGETCVSELEEEAKEVILESKKLILRAIKKVEDAHRVIADCYKGSRRNRCIENDVPKAIEGHRNRVKKYNRDLSEFVKKMVDINSRFDVCLVKELGFVRHQVYHIMNDFNNCVV